MEDNVECLMDKLESYIISCENIVTYKWISQEWNVHVNTAKQLLFSFVNKERSKEGPVNLEVTYFLSGSLKDSDGRKSYQISLVREKDLSKVKSKLDIIVSEHVYSVQRSFLKDLHEIYVIDKVNACNVIKGKCGKASIKCEAAVPRSTEALNKLSLSTALSAHCSIKDDASSEKKSQNAPKVDNSSSKEDQSKIKPVKSEETVTAVNGKVKKDDKKGIAGMFAAQTVKNSEKKPNAESENMKRENSKNIIQKPNTQKNGIANMFAKQAKRPPAQKAKKEEPKNKVNPPKKVTREVEREEEEDPFASEDEVDHRKELMISTVRSKSPVEAVGKGKAPKKEKESKKKKKRSRGSAGEEESPLPTKKRRRIRMMSSSEESSEEEMEIGESESPIPESPKATPKEIEISDDDDDDVIPATPSESAGLGSKKRRKKRTMVNRTFSDERGYVVTKKEYVFVSCSDDTSQSGDDNKTKESKSDDKVNNVDSISSSVETGKENKSKAAANDDKEVISTKEKGAGNKEKKNKESEKGKKNGKKVSPQNVRQGVLTSFFKRS